MANQSEKFSPDRLPSRLGISEPDRQRVVQAARQFRRFPTQSEKLLWQELRGGKLGTKFQRQHPIGPLVVDFCCPRLHLIIEVDGPIHRQQAERDAARQRLLEDRGYRVLRVESEEVERDVGHVVERITALIREHESRPGSPSPSLGEGDGG